MYGQLASCFTYIPLQAYSIDTCLNKFNLLTQFYVYKP